MATASTNTNLRAAIPINGVNKSVCAEAESADSPQPADFPKQLETTLAASRHHELQNLLAFAALHESVLRRREHFGAEPRLQSAAPTQPTKATRGVDEREFVLDEVLELISQRGMSIAGADGFAVALAEDGEIVLRVATGAVRPDLGARIDRNSPFSEACFRIARIVRCDDAETDARVDLVACHQLGARSIVAVPLSARGCVIGLLEAFSAEPFAFSDNDVRNLTMLAQLIVDTLTPEEEDRLRNAAQAAVTSLDAAPIFTQPVPVATEVAPRTPELSFIEPPLPLETTEPEEATTVAPPNSPAEPGTSKAMIGIEPGQAAAVREDTPVLGTRFGGQPPRGHATDQRDRIVLLIAAIILASVFAGGIRWEWKRVQSHSAAPKQAPTNLTPAPEKSAKENPLPTGREAVTGDPPKPTSGGIYQQAQTNSVARTSNFPQVTGIHYSSEAGETIVILDLEDQVQYEAHRLATPDRIYFDLHDTELAPPLESKSINVDDALLNHIRSAQTEPHVTRIVLETKARTDFSVSLRPNPYRLVVELHKNAAKPEGPPPYKPTKVEPAENKSAAVLPAQNNLPGTSKVRIVIDAGHGGRDQGTVGRDGLLEKDLVLQIARRLGKMLEVRLGMDVIYTRQDDNYVSLEERASIANVAQADLFISLHANYSDFPSARGIETYYTNLFATPNSKETGPERATALSNGSADSLSPIALRERVEESRMLAASVQRSLYGTLSLQNPGLRDRGVKLADYVVLMQSTMPGILAEVSFVSSPADEQKLRKDSYREQVAEALYEGIAQFAAAGHVKVASAGR